MEALRRIILREEFVVLLGDPIKAIVLNQFLYWTEIVYKEDQERINRMHNLLKLGESEAAAKLRSEIRDGWFWKTADEMHEEIMISSRATVARRMKELVDEGYVYSGRNPEKGYDRTFRYRANIAFIQEKLMEKGYVLDGYAISQELYKKMFIPPTK